MCIKADSGVPQGTVISPVFVFSIMINSTINLFVDGALWIWAGLHNVQLKVYKMTLTRSN